MRLVFSWWLVTIFCLIGVVSQLAAAKAFDDLTFQSPAQETRYRTLIDEFRCPKCQNANLAGSDAPIAQDLKHKTYILVKQGQSDDQIRQYMTSRYGEFISYKPPMNRSTWMLWFTPPLLLIFGLMFWLVRIRTRQNIGVAPLSAEESWRLNQLLSTETIGKEEINTHSSTDQDRQHDR